MENTAGKPLIYTSKDFNNEKVALGNLKGNLPKIIFAILGIIIIFEVIMGIRALTSSSIQKPPKIQPIGSGQIVVDSKNNAYKMGESIPVTIRITTGGKSSDSTDLILHYDPSLLEVDKSQITPGNIYQDYPVVDVDSETGILRISGITPPDKDGFNGIGELAAINFTAKKNGQAKLEVEFENGSTTDSNIVETGEPRDILTGVHNLTLNISDNPTAQSQATAKVCQGYIQYCQDGKGQAGSQFCSSGALVSDVCGFDPKLSISCTECKIN